MGLVRGLRGVMTRKAAAIGVPLTLAEPTEPIAPAAAGARQCEIPGFVPVPRIRIVTIGDAMRLRDRAVRLPAARSLSAGAPNSRP
ncbi:MAG: hypothetical protein ACK4TB_12105 [Gemmobacter sp.]